MNRQKPFIVEFTGTPEAGKTTVISKIAKDMQLRGYKVKVYPESAELVPPIFTKGTTQSKLWMNLRTAQNILESQMLDNYDIVIFDRGAYDAIFWYYLDAALGIDNSFQFSVLNSYIFTHSPPDLLIILTVSIEESIRRRGGEGHFVNSTFVSQYNRILTAFINSITSKNVVINTDMKTVDEVCNIVLNQILKNKYPSA